MTNAAEAVAEIVENAAEAAASAASAVVETATEAVQAATEAAADLAGAAVPSPTGAGKSKILFWVIGGGVALLAVRALMKRASRGAAAAQAAAAMASEMPRPKSDLDRLREAGFIKM